MKEWNDFFVISRVREGNMAAYEVLYNHYFNKIVSYSFHFVRNEEIAKEITQEVFLKIWLIRTELNPDQYFPSLALSIARNLCIDHLRKQINSQKYEMKSRQIERELILSALTDPVSEKLILEDIEKIVEQSFDSLPKVNQQIFTMSRDAGMTYNEIAARLGVSVKTIEYRMMQTLRVLRSRLKDFLPLFFLFDNFY